MKKFMMSVFIFLFPFSNAFAASDGDWFFLPRAAVGYNIAQGTHFTLGADLGMHFTEQISGGVGAYYAAGEHPGDDREIGGGPFISFVQPITSFLLMSAREDVNYVDMYNPIKTITPSGAVYSHTQETGIASATSVGLHLFITRNLVISGGYRLVLGLTNSKLDDDRSGTFAGISFGI